MSTPFTTGDLRSWETAFDLIDRLSPTALDEFLREGAVALSPDDPEMIAAWEALHAHVTSIVATRGRPAH